MQAFAGVNAEVLVGGGTAANIDYIDSMKQYLPIVIGFVLTLSFVLLTLVFRSIVIPVKAIIMNLLSVGAAYGLIVGCSSTASARRSSASRARAQ